ncbi:hypothetical protein EON64_01150 [archaeon]|nr:MAG: hypothetical protein EON64_01150 [archaeon]
MKPLPVGIALEESHEKAKDFIPSKGLTSEEAATLLLQWGRNELEDHRKPNVRETHSRVTDSFLFCLSIFLFL